MILFLRRYDDHLNEMATAMHVKGGWGLGGWLAAFLGVPSKNKCIRLEAK